MTGNTDHLANMGDTLTDLVNQYNAAGQQVEELEQQLATSEHNLEIWKRALDEANQVSKAEIEENDKLRDMIKRMEPFVMNHKSMEAELSRLKQEIAQSLAPKEARRLKAQVERLKESSSKAQARGEKFQKEVRALRRALDDAQQSNAQQQLTGIHGDGQGGHLIIWPQRFVLSADGKREEPQLCLLYMHDKGHGCLLSLGEGEDLRIPVDMADAAPSKEMQEVAENWLRKVRSQGWKVAPEDLRAIS